MPRLQVIVASTRPGRVGLPVAQWFMRGATRHGGFDAELIDLAEVDLPLMDEPNHPRLGQYTHQHTRDWSARIAAGDAYVFVMPEYNHGYTAPLKNAIDYLHDEWRHKPVGFVSYGGVAAGTRAVQQIKTVVAVLRMVPAVSAVPMPFVAKLLDDDGQVQAGEILEQSAAAMLDELLALEAALRPLRGA